MYNKQPVRVLKSIVDDSTKKQKITKDEKETLERLKSFMGKKENE